MGYNFFEIEKRDNVGILWLNNPENRNLMNWDFWVELPGAMKELNHDNEINCIIIAGRGKSFSLGLDIANFSQVHDFLQNDTKAENRMQLKQLVLDMQESIEAVASSQKPVICAVHRHCFGGGLDLAAACDMRLASEDARFSIFEVRVAIVADMGSIQRLPYIIGEGHTKELAYTGDIINAERAQQIGLVNKVYKDFDTLIAGAMKMAKTIANHSPFVVQGIKHAIDFSRGLSVDESLKYIATYNSAFLHSEEFKAIVKERVESTNKV